MDTNEFIEKQRPVGGEPPEARKGIKFEMVHPDLDHIFNLKIGKSDS